MIETLRKARAGITRLGNRGSAAIEFAFVAPVLLLLVLGTVQFGIFMNRYTSLTYAVGAGALQFAVSRGDTTPYTNAISAIQNATSTLSPASLTITLEVNGTACATDAACESALTAAAPSGGTVQPATVSATYPCGSQFTWYEFWTPTCVLTSTMTESVQ